MTARTAATLDAAADHIERYGWFQGNFAGDSEDLTLADDDKLPCCPVGAINTVVGGNPFLESSEGGAAIDALSDFLRVHRYGGIAEWNDSKAHTADEVIAALRAAADSERGDGDE